MLYLVCAKTKLQHLGETFGEYPFFYYFSRTLVIFYSILSAILISLPTTALMNYCKV